MQKTESYEKLKEKENLRYERKTKEKETRLLVKMGLRKEIRILFIVIAVHGVMLKTSCSVLPCHELFTVCFRSP